SSETPGQGIGIRLANDGLDVAMNDISSNAEKLALVVDEIKATGCAASAHIAEVVVEEAVKNMVEEVVRVHSGLDVVLGTWAGFLMLDTQLMSKATVAECDRVTAVNGRGTFLCCEYGEMQMVSQARGGRIIGACLYLCAVYKGANANSPRPKPKPTKPTPSTITYQDDAIKPMGEDLKVVAQFYFVCICAAAVSSLYPLVQNFRICSQKFPTQKILWIYFQ
ncbi:hypothetical protein DFH08DRAFT_711673, partial [Mycena albidolilacea]